MTRSTRRFLPLLLVMAACKSQPPPGASTSVPASAPAPAAPAAPPAPWGAARLPRGAAVYVSTQLAFLDRAVDTLPEFKRPREQFAAALGGPSLAAALASLGVAGDRPLLAAIVPGDEQRFRKAADKALTVPARPPDTEVGLGTFTRVLLPLSPGADASRLIAPLSAMMKEPVVDRCPGSPACERAGGEGLIAILRGLTYVYAIRSHGDAAEIDQYTAMVEDGTDPQALLALKAFSSAPLGGPESPRCARFDPTAAASLCIDADRTATLGVVHGLGMGLGAVLTDPRSPGTSEISQEQRVRLLKQSTLEANRNIELANPTRRLLDDGTVIVTRTGEKLHSVATWALTSESRAALERAFAAPVRAGGPAFARDVLPRLTKAFGDPGPDFAQPKELVEHMKEAGWTSFPIVFGRIWPNVLLGGMDTYGAKLTPFFGSASVCARVKDGRLELDTETSGTR